MSSPVFNHDRWRLDKWAVTCSGLWLVLMLTGCSGGSAENPDWPARVPASGTVLYKGQPMAEAVVSFINTEAQVTGTGTTDADGHFTLTTYIANDGVVPGPQVVTVRCVQVTDNTPDDVDVSAGGVAGPQKVTWLIPEKYSNATQSGLTATVEANGENEFAFDLE